MIGSKKRLTQTLNHFKEGKVSDKYIIDHIIDLCHFGRKFNIFSFQIGFSVGVIATVLILRYYGS